MNSKRKASVLFTQPNESIHCTLVVFEGSTIEIYNPNGAYSMGLG